MISEEFVRYVIGTYELPPAISERIFKTAIHRLKEYGSQSFDSAYRYIDGLVETYANNRPRSKIVYLDKRIKPDSETMFHDVIGDTPKEDMPEEDETKYSFEETLGAMRGHIDRHDLELIKQLFQGSDLFTHISPQEISANIGEIYQRFQEVVHRYERDGRIIIPNRTIISVTFNPLRIRHKPRCFNRNPLAYYRKNIETYRGLTRTELKDFDSSLYNALITYGQVHLAIPQHNAMSRKQKEKIHKISTSLIQNRGDWKKTCRETGFSGNTVRKWGWKTGVLPYSEKGARTYMKKTAGKSTSSRTA